MHGEPPIPGCASGFLVGLAIGLACWLAASVAGAQPDHVILARVAIHESGWHDTGDMEAIHAVILGVAERRGLTYRLAAHAYAGGALDGTSAKPWASELTPACREPASWPPPPHNRWPAYRERCLAAFARARETVAGLRVHACDVAPHDWGGDCDVPRARRLGLIEIDCGLGDVETLNHYYLRPSLVREGGE